MKNLSIFIFSLFLFSMAGAQEPGSLDLNFNGTGYLISSETGVGRDIAVMDDGKIIIVGYYGNTEKGILLRYNPDGSVDNTFGSNGKVETDFNPSGSELYRAVAVRDNGKIVAAGSIESQSNGDDFMIVQFLPNGTLDANFGNNGKSIFDFNGDNDNLNDLAITSNGKIVVVGNVISSKATNNFAAARLFPNGQLDTDFSYDGKVETDIQSGTDGAYCVVLQDDDKIVAGGVCTTSDLNYCMVRYMPDGSLDNTFNSNGIAIIDVPDVDSEVGRGIGIKSDDKIVMGGTAYNETNFVIAICQCNSDGTLDESFGNDGFAITDVLPGNASNSYDICIQDDDKIVSTGYLTSPSKRNDRNSQSTRLLTTRYNADGSADNDFGNFGIVITDLPDGDGDIARAVSIQPDLKILIGGYFSSITGVEYFTLARYHSGLHVGKQEGISDNSKLHLYPNPAHDRIFIKYTLNTPEKINIELLNSEGKVIQHLFKANQEAGIHNIRINLENVNTGLYYLALHAGNQKMIRKVLIVN